MCRPFLLLAPRERAAHEFRDPVPEEIDQPIQLRILEQIDSDDLKRGEKEIHGKQRNEEVKHHLSGRKVGETIEPELQELIPKWGRDLNDVNPERRA